MNKKINDSLFQEFPQKDNISLYNNKKKNSFLKRENNDSYYYFFSSSTPQFSSIRNRQLNIFLCNECESYISARDSPRFSSISPRGFLIVLMPCQATYPIEVRRNTYGYINKMRRGDWTITRGNRSHILRHANRSDRSPVRESGCAHRRATENTRQGIIQQHK